MNILLAILIQIIYVQGPNSLTPNQVSDLLLNVKAIYDSEFPNKPVKLNFSGIHYDNPKDTYTIANSQKAYFDWRSSLQNSKGNYLVILPPTTDRFIVGYTTHGCHKDNFNSTVVALLQSQNQAGQDRKVHSTYVVAHELAHIYGASHIDTPTIMNPAPLPLVTTLGALPFDIKSKREIRRCIKNLEE